MTNRATLARMLLVMGLVVAPVLAWGADELRIDKPQHTVLTLRNGRRFGGRLFSLNSKEVRFRPAGSADVKTYLVAQVKSVQTADDVLTYDAAAKGFFGTRTAVTRRPQRVARRWRLGRTLPAKRPLRR